jgi:chemotaxis protein methyltransferase CheR
MTPITDTEFERFQRFIFDRAGITMSGSKKSLVCGRLSKRLAARRCDSFGAYFELLGRPGSEDETQIAIDLLTTNETYFFREPKHFELLRRLATQAAAGGQGLRVWSAASSSGEEAYSIAMVLADCLGNGPWEVMGSDISQRVLQRARTGHYPMERARHVPPDYLKRFCLRGTGEQEGTLLVDKALRQRVQFAQVNLNTTLPQLGSFDVVFLRNVMIYFNGDTKRQVVARVLSLLRPGGHFCVGHSESLNDVSDAVKPVAPSIYRKP